MSNQNEIMAFIQVDLGVIATPTHAKVERNPQTGKRIQHFKKDWVGYQGEMIKVNMPKKNKWRITEYISQVLVRKINATQFEYIHSKECGKSLKFEPAAWRKLSSTSKIKMFFSKEYPEKHIDVTILE